MKNIENFIEEPGVNDVPVSQVFTESMFDQLESRMKEAGWGNVRSYWETDFKNRKIVSEFMKVRITRNVILTASFFPNVFIFSPIKDEELGSKRLASMPDRVTNTINVAGSDEPVCRPTVINMYGEDLSTLQKWWENWEVSVVEIKNANLFLFYDSINLKII